MKAHIKHLCALTFLVASGMVATNASATGNGIVGASAGHPFNYSDYASGYWTNSYDAVVNNDSSSHYWDVPLTIIETGISYSVSANWGGGLFAGSTCASAYAVTADGAYSANTTSVCQSAVATTSLGSVAVPASGTLFVQFNVAAVGAEDSATGVNMVEWTET